MKKFIRLSIIVFSILALLTSSACHSVKSATTVVSTSSTPSVTTTISATVLGTATQKPLLEVYFLDVGQGDAEILRYGNQTMLIDAGTNASTTTLLSDIKNLGINEFDVVVVTHPHEDHIGGLDAVINNYSVGTLYIPKVTAPTKTYTDVLTAIKNKGYTVTTPAPGATFNLGGVQCTIIAPNSQSYEDLNNYSIVIKVTYGTTSFLFTGDAEVQSEEEMLAKGYNFKADVLKVGHHGSNSSTSPEFLKAVSPRYAVIEVGQGNDYGHPHQVTLDRQAAANVKIYRTDLNGTAIFKSDGSALTVSTER